MFNIVPAAMAENGHENGIHRHPAPAPHVVRIANPAPLGLCGFALSTFTLSCYNAGIFGISLSTPVNVAVGLAVFYGGIAQLLAGQWEFVTGNTFGATAFSSYGAFWLAWAVIQIPWFGVKAAYVASGHEDDFIQAVSIFLLAWTIFTFMMWLGTLRANIALSALFFCLTITFMFLCIGDFKRSHSWKRAGGSMGIITACIAWYIALAGILTHENSYFTLPVGSLAKR
ncbi:hypothetical protein KC19_3G254200 [Ceratodon purpureus]|uniref:Uncharacterized protein n=1 Tax=Ceratodon purpureus TaxID=3225 RepID=A0A8T0IPW5_CERPU|nr:hypothetical protein KC19_3G254200 [Ceratodon purpureus]